MTNIPTWQVAGESGMEGVTPPMVVTGTTTVNITKLIGVPFCPDLLSIDDMGEADNWRGYVVRGFFTVLNWFDR